MKPNRQIVSQVLLKDIEDKEGNGEIPRILGIPGILALIYDRISKFNKDMDSDHVLDITSLAFVALEMSFEKEGVVTEEPQLTDEEVRQLELERSFGVEENSEEEYYESEEQSESPEPGGRVDVSPVPEPGD